MDADTIRLVRELCARAGMIMEDASATAVLTGKLDDGAVRLLVAQVSDELSKASTLVAAAKMLAGTP
ncbi:hypothetical protein SPAN111604_03705 [Sphingomonas antarctica]|uniref:hypothetical protein n=1 Tax=Sphingomonas antarctica TaxID=2040274 RepID=UPI0039EAEAFC